MQQKKIDILNDLSTSLYKPDFNLEAWKIKASLLLKTLFSPDDERIGLINNLHYDYSSWSLRDHSGGKMTDPVKKAADEIVQSCIIELTLSDTGNPLSEIFKTELKGSRFVELQEILNKKGKKEELIEQFVESLDKKELRKLLIKIIGTIS